MQGKSSALRGSATSLEVRYTGKPVSGWSGLVAVMRYLGKLVVRQVLAQALPDGRTSPNQIPVVEVVLASFAAVLTGGRRFAHVERLRSDEVVQASLGVQPMPSAMTPHPTSAAWCAARSSISPRYSDNLCYAGCARRRSAQCWIWIRPCSSATGVSKAVSKATTHVSTGVPPIIRCRRCWPKPRSRSTPGCVVAIPTRQFAKTDVA